MEGMRLPLEIQIDSRDDEHVASTRYRLRIGSSVDGRRCVFAKRGRMEDMEEGGIGSLKSRPFRRGGRKHNLAIRLGGSRENGLG
mmetsp:Transcript_20310/g.42287  ORF Transcript_20310/g.42287 Transcript_20310/m.42287 type:complete len:85 (-) Transcript_20310:534-788(-)